MATILRPTDETAAAAKMTRNTYRSSAELKMRDAVERWGRARWPGARVVHELVMDRGTVRADVAFIGTDHFAVVEIKSEYDKMTRLIHQCGMFRLASPELWIAAANRWTQDIDLVRFLMPSIGVLLTDRDSMIGKLPDEFELDQVHDCLPYRAHQESMLHLLWVDELRDEIRRAGLGQGGTSKETHRRLVDRLLVLSYGEAVAAVCRQLRGRDAFWRADPPISGSGAEAG